MHLEGKAGIITGAGFGIGRAIAIEFAREGASVVVTDRNTDGVEETARLIEAETPGALVAVRPGDLLDPELPTLLVELCLAQFGTVDILVNNAADQTVAPLSRE